MSLVAPVWTALAAQDRAKDTRSTTVPEAAMPPAGMCRVWLRDVPEHQQPAPSDCATAIRMVPRDAIVLFGDLKRAAPVVPAGGSSAARRGGVPGNIPTFRGIGSAGEGRTGAPRARQGLVGVSAAAPLVAPSAASKAPEAKGALKPEKPQ